MTGEDRQKLVSRLRRIGGQIRALENELTAEPSRYINQNLAVIAGLKAVLRVYLEKQLLSKTELTVREKALLAQLLSKLS